MRNERARVVSRNHAYIESTARSESLLQFEKAHHQFFGQSTYRLSVHEGIVRAIIFGRHGDGDIFHLLPAIADSLPALALKFPGPEHLVGWVRLDERLGDNSIHSRN